MLHLPDLSGKLGIRTDAFEVTGVFAGGMGVCVQVRSVETGQLLALKTVRADRILSRATWDRFTEEMKVWLTLSACSGVVEARCITKVNELPHVCATWMAGGSLRDRLGSRQAPAFYLQAALRVVRTLGWAHAQHGVIHRDLKPENVLFDEADRAHVGDWGIARTPGASGGDQTTGASRSTATSVGYTATGQFIGTVAYASPEQILGLPDIDHRSDVYSLGCVFYEWEAGAPPFDGQSADEIASKHLGQTPPRLDGRPRATRLGLDAVIHRCLAKRPHDRFQRYADLEGAIVEVASTRGVPLDASASQLESRYVIPRIGGGHFAKQLKEGGLGEVRGADGNYAVVEFEKLEPFLREAQALADLGKWREAIDVYARFFVPELMRKTCDSSFAQAITINYADCLTSLGKAAEAIDVLRHLDAAMQKPAEYFVNLSHAYLLTNEPQLAMRVASDGLSRFPRDKDVVGSLLIAQIHAELFDAALKTASLRLELGRDVKALEEVGALELSLARGLRDVDLPRAATHFLAAASLLREAKHANPRYAIVRVNLAKTALSLGRCGSALEELIALRDLDMHVTLRKVWVGEVARCFEMAGEYQRCVETCEEALKKFGDDTHIARIRARAIVDGFCIGHERDGVPIVESSSHEFFAGIVQDHSSRTARDVCYFARLKEWMGETDLGLAMLEAAAQRDPQSWELVRELALLTLRSAGPQEAHQRARDAVRLAPWRSETWAALELVERVPGREQEAAHASSEAARVEVVRQKAADALGEL